jgi:hypothetical protein
MVGVGDQAILEQRHGLLQQAGLLQVPDAARLHQQLPGIVLAENGKAAWQARQAGTVLDQQPGHDGVEGAELSHGGYLARFARLPEFRAFQAAVLEQRRRAQLRPGTPAR